MTAHQPQQAFLVRVGALHLALLTYFFHEYVHISRKKRHSASVHLSLPRKRQFIQIVLKVHDPLLSKPQINHHPNWLVKRP